MGPVDLVSRFKGPLKINWVREVFRLEEASRRDSAVACSHLACVPSAGRARDRHVREEADGFIVELLKRDSRGAHHSRFVLERQAGATTVPPGDEGAPPPARCDRLGI